MNRIIEDRIRREREQILRLMEVIRKSDTANLGIVNYSNGKFSTPFGADVVIDRRLIAQVLRRAKFIKEGSFNENGGTPDYFYEKYGSWERVIESSLSANPGADACLGLYDKYYDTYFLGEELGAPDTYTVVSGDSLMSIAERLFGDREMWESLYTWNQDQIKDPNLIYPGQVLNINAQ